LPRGWVDDIAEMGDHTEEVKVNFHRFLGLFLLTLAQEARR
jgi:hypothetical protein